MTTETVGARRASLRRTTPRSKCACGGCESSRAPRRSTTSPAGVTPSQALEERQDDMAVTEKRASADAGADGVSCPHSRVIPCGRLRRSLLTCASVGRSWSCSPSLPSAGVLVRVGDLGVLGGLTMVEGGAPPIVHKVVARLNTTQVLVAPPQIHSKYGAWHLSRLLTEDWRLVDGANPHLLIPHLGVQVNAETVAIREAPPRDDGSASSARASRRSEPPQPTKPSSYEGETSGREPSDSTRDRASSQAGVSRPAKKLCITVALSSATVSLAVSEAVFLQSLLPEVGQLIANHGRSHATKAVPKSPRTTARRQGAAAEPSFAMLTETSENDSSGRFEDTLQATAHRVEPRSAPPGVDVVSMIQLDLVCGNGLCVQLVDDAEDALMPSYEIGLTRIRMHAEADAHDVADETPLAMTSGTATLAVVVEASHFNTTNGHWEPIVEAWHLEGEWQGKARGSGEHGRSADGVDPGRSEDRGGARMVRQRTAVPRRRCTAPLRAARVGCAQRRRDACDDCLSHRGRPRLRAGGAQGNKWSAGPPTTADARA